MDEHPEVASGQKQINFYGFSYGTYLGQVYATLHPDRVRRSSSTQRRPAAGLVPGQPRPGLRLRHEHGQRTSTGSRKHDDVYHLGNDRPGRSSAPTTQPQPALRTRRAGSVGADSGPTSFLGAGYVQLLLARHRRRPSRAAVNTRTTRRSLCDDAQLARALRATTTATRCTSPPQCTDAPWPRSWSTWHARQHRRGLQHPFLTWTNAWFNAPCRDLVGQVRSSR